MVSSDTVQFFIHNPHYPFYALGGYFALMAHDNHSQYRSTSNSAEATTLRDPQDQDFVRLRGVFQGCVLNSPLSADDACLSKIKITQTYVQKQTKTLTEKISYSPDVSYTNYRRVEDQTTFYFSEEEFHCSNLFLKLENVRIKINNPKRARLEGTDTRSRCLKDDHEVAYARSRFPARPDDSYSTSEKYFSSGTLVTVAGILNVKNKENPHMSASITPTLITRKDIAELRSEYGFMRKLYAILSCIFLYLGRKLQQWKYPPK
jgi:hypothetical protein